MFIVKRLMFEETEQFIYFEKSSR